MAGASGPATEQPHRPVWVWAGKCCWQQDLWAEAYWQQESVFGPEQQQVDRAAADGPAQAQPGPGVRQAAINVAAAVTQVSNARPISDRNFM
jgi:hypothetical protein